MSASPTREGPEQFREDSGWEPTVARAVCLLRAHSLLRSEDYLENGRARYRLCEIQAWQQYTPKYATEGDDRAAVPGLKDVHTEVLGHLVVHESGAL